MSREVLGLNDKPGVGPRAPIPRDIVCWYCRNGQHVRCALPETCACWTCYPRSACTLCQGVCSWACFQKDKEA